MGGRTRGCDAGKNGDRLTVLHSGGLSMLEPFSSGSDVLLGTLGSIEMCVLQRDAVVGR